MGDPSKMVLLEAVTKTIKLGNLLELAAESGNILLSGLKDLAKKYPRACSAARGLGTHCAFDCDTVERRTRLLDAVKSRGLHLGGSGERSVRFRPTLIFRPHHANMALDILDASMKAVN
ncbi:PREDICTED: 4-aminobutyrate aminotransferase, mitochondrial-like [Priapulus caudatus]|uniref:4-aminobutyrate aminotransferase, mitochondrial-like n=1 Tax=Priapulus caudatus TaxID=37621 RepID=A0ABM1EQ16_PRICU|nr:PREDICTED: 4-aminobutyrate aminotransferase, mitochondrial-like [Priapulus caudatus]